MSYKEIKVFLHFLPIIVFPKADKNPAGADSEFLGSVEKRDGKAQK